jgi:hypothetical protein
MTETDQTTAQTTTNGQSPWEAQRAAATDDAPERPELLVGAALLGGIVLAQLLKRLGGGD